MALAYLAFFKYDLFPDERDCRGSLNCWENTDLGVVGLFSGPCSELSATGEPAAAGIEVGLSWLVLDMSEETLLAGEDTAAVGLEYGLRLRGEVLWCFHFCHRDSLWCQGGGENSRVCT